MKDTLSWINACLEDRRIRIRDHLRKVNEERWAAYYATWRAVTAPFRGLVEALRRARRERGAAPDAAHRPSRGWASRLNSDVRVGSEVRIQHRAHECLLAVGLPTCDLARRPLDGRAVNFDLIFDIHL